MFCLVRAVGLCVLVGVTVGGDVYMFVCQTERERCLTDGLWKGGVSPVGGAFFVWCYVCRPSLSLRACLSLLCGFVSSPSFRSSPSSLRGYGFRLFLEVCDGW